jgi:hypothetical protein
MAISCGRPFQDSWFDIAPYESYCFLMVRTLIKPMTRKRKRVEAIGYMRTSSAANVGRDKDSGKRQRAAIEGYAKAAGYVVVEWFYDAAIKGADAVTSRPAHPYWPHRPRPHPALSGERVSLR